jgi:hypothetical protein
MVRQRDVDDPALVRVQHAGRPRGAVGGDGGGEPERFFLEALVAGRAEALAVHHEAPRLDGAAEHQLQEVLEGPQHVPLLLEEERVAGTGEPDGQRVVGLREVGGEVEARRFGHHAHQRADLGPDIPGARGRRGLGPRRPGRREEHRDARRLGAEPSAARRARVEHDVLQLPRGDPQRALGRAHRLRHVPPREDRVAHRRRSRPEAEASCRFRICIVTTCWTIEHTFDASQ